MKIKIIILICICIPVFSQSNRDINNYVTLKEYFDTKLEALDLKTAERYPTRTEYIDKLNELQKDILSLREYRALMDGKASQSSVDRSYLVSGLSALLSSLSLVIAIRRNK